MRDIFPEYYEPSPTEFRTLWDKGVFILDTNVLLDLHRYSIDSRDDFFAILENEKFRQRLWLPHQIAYEFQKNRLKVIIGQDNEFLNVEKSLTDGLEKLVTTGASS